MISWCKDNDYFGGLWVKIEAILTKFTKRELFKGE